MARPYLGLAALVLFSLGCALGSSVGADDSTSESGGGVPVSKSTPLPNTPSDTATEGASPEESPPTSVPAPTHAEPQAQPTVPPDAGDLPVQISDLNVTGADETPILIGLVQNVGTTDLSRVLLSFSFHDEAGTVVQVEDGSAVIPILEPGDYSPFSVFFPRGIAPETNNVSASAEWREASADYPWTRTGLSVTELVGSMGPFNFEISGFVTNSTSVDLVSVTLYPIAYNADGRIIGHSIKVLGDVEAGQSLRFQATIPGGSSLAEPEVDHFEVLVSGRVSP